MLRNFVEDFPYDLMIQRRRHFDTDFEWNLSFPRRRPSFVGKERRNASNDLLATIDTNVIKSASEAYNDGDPRARRYFKRIAREVNIRSRHRKCLRDYYREQARKLGRVTEWINKEKQRIKDYNKGVKRNEEKKTRKLIQFDEGWNSMQTGIEKLHKLLEGDLEPFTSEDFMKIYTTMYNLSSQKPPHDHSQKLYEKCRDTFVEYISSMVLPYLREKHDEFMLLELVKRWNIYKIMIRWLSRFFHYLDRYFISKNRLPNLSKVGLTCFHELVCEETKVKRRDAVIALINQERKGEEIDKKLLKNVLGIYVEIGMVKMECYEMDFEDFICTDARDYYRRKASDWITEYSCHDYLLKAEDCLKTEKQRVDNYLHASSAPKLLTVVQKVLWVEFLKMEDHFTQLQMDDFTSISLLNLWL